VRGLAIKPPMPLLNQGGELITKSSPPILGGVAKGRGGKDLVEKGVVSGVKKPRLK
jgi:hypothetical protein